jgi:hypothetical protein
MVQPIFTTAKISITGFAQQLGEVTATGRYALLDRLAIWAEFRNDWSNKQPFERGNSLAATGHQPTLLIGIIVFLRPKS